MSEPQKKAVWLWIVAAIIILPLLYLASFGPACLLVDRNLLSISILVKVFRPCLVIMVYGPEPVSSVFWSWASACGGENLTQKVLSELFSEPGTWPR